MNQITVEFFHDVICSFCFPMSYRMRQLQKMMPQVRIVHRSFALVQTERDFDRMFGSRAAAKTNILSHWEQANQNDDLHRFQIDAMRRADFPFPVSIKPLTACKAAYFTAGDEGYWNLFDALQAALFIKAQDVANQAVIEACVRQCGLHFDQWKQHYEGGEAAQGVMADLRLAEAYAIQSVPCLVVDGGNIMSGALPLETLVEHISGVAGLNGAACRLTDDGFDCT